MTRFAEVTVFPHRVPMTKRTPAAYTYAIPDEWSLIEAGQLVLAPFGRQYDFDRLVSGVVVRVTDQSDVSPVKPLEALLHPIPVVSPLHLELAQWLSDTYVEPLSNCVRLFSPPGQSIHSDIEYALIERDAALPNLGKSQAELIDLLRSRGPLRAGQINAAFAPRDWKGSIDRLIEQGWVMAQRALPAPSTRTKRMKWIKATDHTLDIAAISLGRSPEIIVRREAILKFLLAHTDAIEADWLMAETGGLSEDLRYLEARQLIEVRQREVLRDPLADRIFVPVEPPTLTQDQADIWDEIRTTMSLATSFLVYLLFGITGSGKTEIYLRAAAEVLKQGQQAIILVPEIALTPQTIKRFATRFSDRLAVWHSELSLNERFDTWRRVQLGQVDIVIGARSALFLPFDKLGLIVLDEEHDNSYKQSDAGLNDNPVRQPLYHTREAAVELARLSNATVILGSATPSLEAWSRAQRGEYRLLRLSQRILSHAQIIDDQQARYHVATTAYQVAEADALFTTLPPVQIVDLRAELKAGNTHIFSLRLQQALTEVLARKQQAILFMNRRGSATFVMCRDCGEVLKCKRCDSPLTYHEPIGSEQTPSVAPTLICHTCNHHEVQPQVCPQCQSKRIRYFGAGTQKIESELATRFPSARVLRWDRDTTTTKGAHELILQKFSDHQADVLVGTQMIAKGLDLPLVTLVGVISADTSLNLPDFRATERTFQLLTQVAGRAGRGLLGGRAIIQTYTPDQYAIETAAHHDYEGFAARELDFRQLAKYPPYTRLARLLVWDKKADRAQKQAERVAEQIEAILFKRGIGRGSLIGPAPCFFAKVRDFYRWHIILRHPDPASIVREVPLGMNWRVDVDPMSVL
ncbi:MAG: primosomal protein N' [Thermoflexales bacterium]|nr:primosomal protein N' [Thermoflexales bacterium]